MRACRRKSWRNQARTSRKTKLQVAVVGGERDREGWERCTEMGAGERVDAEEPVRKANRAVGVFGLQGCLLFMEENRKIKLF